jgi:carboxypeptidase Taq
MNQTLLSPHIDVLTNLLNTINQLNWDSSVNMPVPASQARGRQIGCLSGMAQDVLVSDTLREALSKADTLADPYAQQTRATLEHAVAHHRKIPKAVLREQSELIAVAQPVWKQARSIADFGIFLPYLEKIVALKRRLADLIGYDEHPYEALAREYEPGLRSSFLQDFFVQLKRRQQPLIHKVHTAAQPRTDFLRREFPAHKQREFIASIIQKIGYDFDRGRLDMSTHPFEISMTRNDVRITTRFNENFINAGLFGGMHEAGHAMYEQSVSPTLSGTVHVLDLIGLYSVAGTSYGVHESQSRLWENQVGRTLGFWQNHFAELQQAFPAALGDVGVEEFHRAINCSQPSLIRVEADELTYDMHVMLRVEIEMGLLDGSVQVKDLPAIWSQKMSEYLGVTPPNDGVGVLQDIHWSKGLFGSFPTYTLGNAMAAQFMHSAKASDPAITAGLQTANYAPLANWLATHIHQYGRVYSPSQLMERSTGSVLRAEFYLDYLEDKYTRLYNL